jgi:hypothetical protein
MVSMDTDSSVSDTTPNGLGSRSSSLSATVLRPALGFTLNPVYITVDKTAGG